ncbi:hypothetical protein CSOJ01_15987 [Colletotrichum sojae]|uniref:Uncharacterized protein n=1 Tax=Colletotrichum sojae TaxID=2175907 RepID=A0A8H6IKZ2_9PEZI|nr:hypothetical protein CSOJ01_15987 [Colletotrichum sojae]
MQLSSFSYFNPLVSHKALYVLHTLSSLVACHGGGGSQAIKTALPATLTSAPLWWLTRCCTFPDITKRTKRPGGCEIMATITNYHAIQAGGAQPSAEVDHEAAVQRLDPDEDDDTDCDMESGGPRKSNAPGPHISLSKAEAENISDAVNLDPGFLNQQPLVLRVLSWTWEIILTALPLFFIVLAILAIKLDGSPVETEYGGRVVEIT